MFWSSVNILSIKLSACLPVCLVPLSGKHNNYITSNRFVTNFLLTIKLFSFIFIHFFLQLKYIMFERIMSLLFILSYMSVFLTMGDETVEVVKTASAAAPQGEDVNEDDKNSRTVREIVVVPPGEETTALEYAPENIGDFLKRLNSFVDSLDVPQETNDATDLADVDLTELSVLLAQLEKEEEEEEETPSPSDSESGK